jgi:hypothetical protein
MVDPGKNTLQHSLNMTYLGHRKFMYTTALSTMDKERVLQGACSEALHLIVAIVNEPA